MSTILSPESGEVFDVVEVALTGRRVPALMIGGRVERRSLPAGVFAYSLRSPDEGTRLGDLQRTPVLVNHWADLVTLQPLLSAPGQVLSDFGWDEGEDDVPEGQFSLYHDSDMPVGLSLSQFQALYGSEPVQAWRGEGAGTIRAPKPEGQEPILGRRHHDNTVGASGPGPF